jgi:tripartite-type tricarboxylate transporter receptor subunit TctC
MQHLIAKVLVSAVFAATSIMSPAMAQTYPNKALKLIVPTAPGGGYDTVGRLLSERLAAELGQAIVVENRAGSGGVIGTLAAAQAAPDGYTLVVGGLANLAFNQGLYEKLPYNAATDFVPIALVGSFSYTLVGRKDLPQSTLREVIDYARANPGKLTIATAGTGTGQHIAAALLKNLAKIDITEVPYKGAQPAYTDIFGDRVDLFFDNTATMRPFLEAGRVKAFAISSPARDPLVPQVPTVKEAGLDGLVLESWIGLFAPAKTPQPVIDKLRSALAKAVASGDLASRFGTLGIRTVSMTPKDTEAYVKAEIEKWPRFFRQASIKAE